MIEDIIGEIEQGLKAVQYTFMERGIQPTSEHVTLYNMYLIGFNKFPELYDKKVVDGFDRFFQETYYKNNKYEH